MSKISVPEPLFRRTAVEIQCARGTFPPGTEVKVHDGLGFVGYLLAAGLVPRDESIDGYLVQFPNGVLHFIEPECLLPIGAEAPEEKPGLRVLEGGKQ